MQAKPRDRGRNVVSPSKPMPGLKSQMDKRAILAALDFESYFSEEVASLLGDGARRTAFCLFHEDRRGSLTINIEKGSFTCADCGANGDLIAFHMKKYNLGFHGTLVQLAERALRSEQSLPVSDEDQTVDAIIARLNLKHFIVQVGGKTYIATEKRSPVNGHLDLEFGSMADFTLLYKNRTVLVEDRKTPISTLWLASPDRRQYDGIDFFPGREIPGYFNLWRGFAVEPRKGSCALFWQHLFFIICRGDRGHYWYLRKWLAHLIQHPAELPGVAIVIRGKQGTGKTLFADFVGRLLGQHYLMLTRMEQLTGRFTGHLKDALLVCANEAVWGGDKHGEGALKSLITDATTPVELKGKDLFFVLNYKRLVATTNEEWAVPMAMDDRRFLILEASDEKKEDKAYFGALVKQMADGGSEALMHDLMHEDLADFDVRTKPQSSLGFDIKLQSADPVVRWLYERLYEGLLAGCTIEDQIGDICWDREPSKEVLFNIFIDFCHTQGMRTLTPSVFGKKILMMLPGCTIGETRPAGRARGRRYTLPSLQSCREGFQRFAKAGPEIWV